MSDARAAGLETPMKKSSYAARLMGEFIAFAHQNRSYWLIPLIALLAIAGLFVVGGQTITPLIYTIF